MSAPRIYWLAAAQSGEMSDGDLCDLGADSPPRTLGEIKEAVKFAADSGVPGFERGTK